MTTDTRGVVRLKKMEGWQWAALAAALLFFVGLALTSCGGHHTNFDHYDVDDCLYSPSKKKMPDSIFPLIPLPDENPKIEKVSCFDPKANYQILKRIPGDEGSCEGTPGLVATYTKTRDGDRDYTLCLGDWG
jgi:hypothetical protein